MFLLEQYAGSYIYFFIFNRDNYRYRRVANMTNSNTDSYINVLLKNIFT